MFSNINVTDIMQTFSIKDLLQLESGNVIDILYAISVTINNLGVIIKACNRIFIKINWMIL